MKKAIGCPNEDGELQCKPNLDRENELKNLKQKVTQSIEDILLISNQAIELVDLSIKVNDSGLTNEINLLLEKISKSKGSEISIEINNLKTKYSNILNESQKDYLVNLSSLVDSNFDKYKNL